jgi:hypothetical protein
VRSWTRGTALLPNDGPGPMATEGHAPGQASTTRSPPLLRKNAAPTGHRNSRFLLRERFLRTSPWLSDGFDDLGVHEKVAAEAILRSEAGNGWKCFTRQLSRKLSRFLDEVNEIYYTIR